MDEARNYWRLCSTCKKEIPFRGMHYACSVSTCNQKRALMSFCSLPCFMAHVPILRHRDAWAEEKRAPSLEQWASERAEQKSDEQRRAAEVPAPMRADAAPSRAPVRPAVIQRATPDADSQSSESRAGGHFMELNDADIPSDILIVASKLKQYIRARSGMKTSDGVMTALSDIVRGLCDQAVRNAERAERKTVLDRDFAIDKLELRGK